MLVTPHAARAQRAAHGVHPRRPTPTARSASSPPAPAPQDAPPGSDPFRESPDQLATEAMLLRRQVDFDIATRARAEFARERDVLRDLAMEQVKRDDENLKKWISLV